MNNMKMQAALDEIGRLFDTVYEFKKRNGEMPNPNSDAGRSYILLQNFIDELRKFNLQQIGISI